MTLLAPNKVAFEIGNLSVKWYGIIITLAMLLCLVYAMIEFKRLGLKSDDALEAFLWIIPIAVVFARIFYIMVRPEEYFPWNSWDDFVHAIAIWDGGITIVGGVFGGIIGGIIFWYRHRDKVTVPELIDVIVPTLLLAQSIGRWGNFINQEAYGAAISAGFPEFFPFSVYIEHCTAPGCTCGGAGWHYATFIYEAAWNFIGAVGFYFVWRLGKKFRGVLGFAYLFWYFLIRGLMEYLRMDAVPITQVLCFVVFPIALALGILYIAFKAVYNKVRARIENGEEIDTNKADYKIYKFVAHLWKKIIWGKKRAVVGVDPYGNPVIGYAEELKAQSGEAVDSENFEGGSAEGATDAKTDEKTEKPNKIKEFFGKIKDKINKGKTKDTSSARSENTADSDGVSQEAHALPSDRETSGADIGVNETETGNIEDTSKTDSSNKDKCSDKPEDKTDDDKQSGKKN